MSRGQERREILISHARRVKRKLEEPPFDDIPFLVACYPVVYFFEVNAWSCPNPIAPGFTGVFTLAVALWITRTLKQFVSRKEKALLLSALILFFLFDYSQIFHGALSTMPPLTLLRQRQIFFIISLGIFVTALAIFCTKKNLVFICTTIRFIFLGLLLLSVGRIALRCLGHFDKYQKNQKSVSASDYKKNAPVLSAGDQAGLPNIYYIILDAHASEETLLRDYSFSNSRFIERLRRKGFYVADKSHSNYSYTVSSVASSLNMEYWDSETAAIATMDFVERIKRNKVCEYLSTKGYSCIQKNYFNRVDNDNYAYFLSYLKTTIFSFAAIVVENELQRREVLRGFKELSQLSEKKGPFFLYAHLPGGHEPFVFDQNGGSVSWTEILNGSSTRNNKSLYLQQIQFYEKKIEELIELILSRKGPPPIIIIQGDHGPDSLRNRPGRPASQAFLKERFGILNAFYAPAVKSELYAEISPVNSFCILLKQFGRPCEPLDYRAYFRDDSMSKQFIDVTDKVQGSREVSEK